MLLQDLLGINEDVYLVEPGYYSQKTIGSTIQYLKDIRAFIDVHAVRTIRINAGSRTTGLAVFNPATEEVPVDFWSFFTSAVATQHRAEFESLADEILTLDQPGRVIEVKPEQLEEALVEYYSLLLVNRETCTDCTMQLEPYDRVYTEDRISNLSQLLGKLISQGIPFEENMLEICCGNGMSTIALHRLGFDPVAIEYEKCAVCEGLEHGVLKPKKSLVMDATMLSSIFDAKRFDCVVGFMLGTIYEFNADMWSRMMLESAKVAKEGAVMLFTVKTKPEMDILEKALHEAGVEGEVIDNTDDAGMYDQWVFSGRKLNHAATYK